VKILSNDYTSPNTNQRPHDAIIINEDKQQSELSEVDLKSEVGNCSLPKSPQVVLGTSRRLEVSFITSWVGLAH